MPPEAEALVLDFGGVVTRTLFETHDLTEKALGLPGGTLTWKGPFDPASDSALAIRCRPTKFPSVTTGAGAPKTLQS